MPRIVRRLNMDAATVPPPRSRQLQRYLVVALIGLAIGLVPTLISLYQARSTAADLRDRLQMAELENHLARSAVMARHGDYAAARDAASAFFTAAGEQLATEASLSSQRADALRALLADRDDVITLLARGDPAGADRMSAMYLSYRAAPLR